jgi:phosphate/sulfate permease
VVLVFSHLVCAFSFSSFPNRAANNFGTDDLPFSFTIPVACGLGVLVGGIWLWPLGPYAKRRIESGAVHLAKGASKKSEKQVNGTGTEHTRNYPPSKDNVEDANVYEESEGGGYSEGGEVDVDDPTTWQDKPKKERSVAKSVAIVASATAIPTASPAEEEAGDKNEKNIFKKMSQTFAENTYGQDLHAQSMHEDQRAAQIWENAELYDENVEQMFTYVQVFTACLNAFAHGANDVANAIAPISAIISIYQTGEVEKKTGVQKWLLAYGGAAIVIGLLLYGYKVMKSIGYKLTMMSPSRGASAELAASFTVVTASFLAIPVSSTQCIVGAVSGVGLTQGWKNVQWLFLGRVCVAWVGIFFISATLSAGVFSFCAFSPSI